MAETKNFASLSSGLLARKGGAKPAMRPHNGLAHFNPGLDDLGWNDMGHAESHEPTPIHALTPSPAPRSETEASKPAVLEQQQAIEESFAAGEAPAVVALPRRREAASSIPARDKAAFTLRLDPERHLKLRLACAVSGRSAQHLVTEALDDFLNSQPELEALAGRVPAEAGRRSR